MTWIWGICFKQHFSKRMKTGIDILPYETHTEFYPCIETNGQAILVHLKFNYYDEITFDTLNYEHPLLQFWIFYISYINLKILTRCLVEGVVLIVIMSSKFLLERGLHRPSDTWEKKQMDKMKPNFPNIMRLYESLFVFVNLYSHIQTKRVIQLFRGHK